MSASVNASSSPLYRHGVPFKANCNASIILENCGVAFLPPQRDITRTTSWLPTDHDIQPPLTRVSNSSTCVRMYCAETSGVSKLKLYAKRSLLSYAKYS